MSATVDPKCEFLRHCVATLAYRAGKAVAGAGPEFAHFRAGDSTRTPVQVLAHIGDLLHWGLSIAEGNERWQNSSPLEWSKEVDRFFAALKAFDDFLASGKTLGAPAEKLFQGPVADALAHTGQIAMLRRLASTPVKGENYAAADIRAGRVGADQTPPKREFD